MSKAQYKDSFYEYQCFMIVFKLLILKKNMLKKLFENSKKWPHNKFLKNCDFKWDI